MEVVMVGRDARNEGPEAPSSEDEGFLGRWSRRKADARASDPAPAINQAVPDETGSEIAGHASEDVDQPEPFDVESLPDIDSLGPKSDFSVFMQAGVPSELKTKALRKLWRVKSELANLDGLIDYGEDLTGSFKTVEHLKTAYEVGRGFLRHDEDDTVVDDEEALADQSAAGDVTPVQADSETAVPVEDAADQPAPAKRRSKTPPLEEEQDT
jgi:hypothetical protein